MYTSAWSHFVQPWAHSWLLGGCYSVPFGTFCAFAVSITLSLDMLRWQKSGNSRSFPASTRRLPGYHHFCMECSQYTMESLHCQHGILWDILGSETCFDILWHGTQSVPGPDVGIDEFHHADVKIRSSKKKFSFGADSWLVGWSTYPRFSGRF